MAIPQIGPSPLEAFQIGQQSRGGPSALGQFAMLMTQRAMQMSAIREEARAKAGAEAEFAPQIAKAKADASPFAALIRKSIEGSGASGGTGSDFTLTVFNTEGTGTFESPSAKASVTGAETSAKDAASIGPHAASLRDELKRLKRLADQVPAPKAGLGYPKDRIGMQFQGMTRTIPQIPEYENTLKSIAGALARVVGREASGRLSNQDLQRQLDRAQEALYGTTENRALAMSGLLNSLNNNPQVTATLGRTNPLEILSEEEFKIARQLEGRGEGEFVSLKDGRLAFRYKSGEIEELE